MTAKERDAVFQHWRSVILRETRDLASLERVGARALQARDVRADAALEGLIRAELAQRRAEMARERRSEESAARQSRPAAQHSDYAGRRTTAPIGREPRSESPPVSPPPATPAPAPAHALFDRLTQTLREALARGDENAARVVHGQLRALQAESPEVVSAGELLRYEQQIAKLGTRLADFRVQIAALVQQAVTASRNGDEPAAAALLRRLSAIHVTYPHLLDEARLDEVRADIIRANEQHDDGVTARHLLERERAVAAEITKIAAAVHAFHRVVCEVPDSSAEFRSAAAAYRRTLQEVRAHDPEWLAGFVLELADLLAEWRLPSRAVGKQIDRFLERVRLSMKRIHVEMGLIAAKRDEADRS